MFAIKGVQIKRIQKIGLALIFCIILGTVALEIARTTEGIINWNEHLTWVLEINFTVMVSSLLTYRALIGWKKRIAARRGPDRSFEQVDGTAPNTKDSHRDMLSLSTLDDSEHYAAEFAHAVRRGDERTPLSPLQVQAIQETRNTRLS